MAGAAPGRLSCGAGAKWARGQRHLPGCSGPRRRVLMSVRFVAGAGHVLLLDFDREVVAIAPQPFWLCWRDGEGRARRHAPDFINVRPDAPIEAKDAEAFDATKRACGLVGRWFQQLGFLVLCALRTLPGCRATSIRDAVRRMSLGCCRPRGAAPSGRSSMTEPDVGTVRIPGPHSGGSRGPVRLSAIRQPSGLPAMPDWGPPLLRVPPRFPRVSVDRSGLESDMPLSPERFADRSAEVVSHGFF